MRSLSDVELLGRIRTELHRSLKAAADEVAEVGHGFVLRTRTLPDVWTLNQLRITGPSPVPDILALADEHQGDLSYRHVVADDPGAGSSLEAALEDQGWVAEHDVLMVLGDAPVPGPPPDELAEHEMLMLMRAWATEEHAELDQGSLDQLAQYQLREAADWRQRCFGARDVSGEPVALTKLRTRGSVAWVEDVYTRPEHRGRGYARRLVGHAAAVAGAEEHQLTFIIGDADDWPQRLYASLGFRPVGRGWIFHRPG